MINTLTFPTLNSLACTVEFRSHACYLSYNNVSGLTAESMQINSGDDYVIGGEALTLGKSGLSSSPSTTSNESTFAALFMPLLLGAEQTWHIEGTERAYESELYLGKSVTGTTDKLQVEMGSGAVLGIGENVDVGPLTVNGVGPNQEGFLNGVVALFGGNLNASDGEPVSLKHVSFYGAGAVGPLTSTGAELDVASGPEEGEGTLRTTEAALDPESFLELEVSKTGTTGGTDYSQLVSSGTVELNGAEIGVFVQPPEPGSPCPILTPGETLTLVSTTGALSGTFANAPEGGPEIPITAPGCASQMMRITYNRSGATKTVDATVEAKKAEEEQEAKEKAEREAKEKAEKEARERAEREAKEKAEREAKKGVLGLMESSPDVTIAPRSVVVSPSGALVLKIKCPPGEASCTGTITLRTLHAVNAGGRKHGAKHKRKVLTLAKATFTVAGGHTKSVRLHLSHEAKKMLAHAHLLRALAMLVASNPSGASHTTREKVTLHARKRKHHKG